MKTIKRAPEATSEPVEPAAAIPAPALEEALEEALERVVPEPAEVAPNHDRAERILASLHRSQVVIEFNPDGTTVSTNEMFLSTSGSVASAPR